MVSPSSESRTRRLPGRSARSGPAAELVRPRLADEVARVLRDMILCGELEPGTPLLQIQLSERLGVSRTPLREAFRVLERDGLVCISNGNKTVEVVQLDIERMLQSYEVREVIDGLAARLLARAGLTAELEASLERWLVEMEDSSRVPADLTRYAQGHSAFHGGIVEGAGNPELMHFLPLVRLTSHMQTYRLVQQVRHHHPRAMGREDIAQMLCVGNEDHRAIYDALREGRARDAEEIAKRHIRKAARLAADLRDRLRMLDAAAPV